MIKMTVLRKVMSLVIIGALTLSFAGCGKTEAPETTVTTETSATTETPAESTTESTITEEQIELKFSHIWGSTADPFTNTVQTVISNFEAENPNIKIIVDINENEAYKTKIKAMGAANELPDVFFAWGGGFSKPFVDAGAVLAIDEYLTEEVKGKLINGALTNVTYGDKVYGMTFMRLVGALFVNTELFENNNAKIPENFDELVTAVKLFKSKGITPMAIAGKDKWTIAMLNDVMALRAAGSEKVVNALTKKGTFNDPDFLNLATKMKLLVDSGAFAKDAGGLTNDEAEIPFFEGKIPMMFKGSWLTGKIDAPDSKVAGKIKAISFPIMTDGKGSDKQFTGGAVDSIMVSSNTENKEAAVKFQLYFAENMAREAYLSGSAMPAWKVEVDESKINPAMVEIVNLTKDSDPDTIWWDTLLEGKDTETYLNALQELFLGLKTPQEYVDSLQSIYE